MQTIFTSRQLRMRAGEVRSLPPGRLGCLRIDSGRVWVTVAGSRADYWLSGGQSLALPAQGLVVIESVDSASKLQLRLYRRPWRQDRLRPWMLRVAGAVVACFRRGRRCDAAIDKCPELPQSCSQ